MTVNNKEIRDNIIKWCEALESGNYKQIGYGLRKKKNYETRYCCLGVCLDIFDPDGWVSREGDIFAHLKGKNYSETDGGEQYLSPEFARSVGLNSLDVRYLASLNDAGRSFKDIAEYIRAYILIRYANANETE